MDFELFTEEMRRLLENWIGKDYQVQIQKIMKNNACSLTGLVIHKIGENVEPVIYLEPYYEKFKEGDSLELLAKELFENYQKHGTEQISDDFIKRLIVWVQAKDMVLYKIINTEKNKDLLEKMPYREYLDLSIVYYMYLGQNDSGQYTVPISNDHMKLWGVTEEDLYQVARENTPLIFPGVIKTMEDVLSEIIKDHFGDVINDDIVNEVFLDQPAAPIFYVCTNYQGVNGAVCMLYEGILAEFAEKYGCDMVILPSSIHEVLLIPDKGETDYGEMREMVTSINESEVSDEDVLSNRVYRYSLLKGEIELVG